MLEEIEEVCPPVLEILYQDEYLVAVNKPANMLVHRSMIDRRETVFVMQTLRNQLGQHVFPLHRLDKPTSGVLLFALSSEVAAKMAPQFANDSISKTYWAIVRGYMPEAGHIDYALKEKLDKIADKKAKQDKPAQEAQTDYRCLAQVELPIPVRPHPSSRYSLVELKPLTGRKHQLRRHMSHLSHPIVGDTTHGDGKHNQMFRDKLSARQLMLSARTLVFEHPETQEKIKVSAPLDEVWTSVLTQLGWQSFLDQEDDNGEDRNI